MTDDNRDYLTVIEGDPLGDLQRAHRRPTTITVEIDVDTSKFVAGMLKAQEVAADYRAQMDKLNAIISPSIPVADVLAIIDKVAESTPSPPELKRGQRHACRLIRERIEEATR